MTIHNTEEFKSVREKSVPPKSIAVIITLSIQIAVIVWGASKISSSVNNLDRTVIEVKASMTEFKRDLTAIQIDAAIRKERLDALERRYPP